MLLLTPELLRIYPTGASSTSSMFELSARVRFAGTHGRVALIQPPCSSPCPTLRHDLAAAMLPLVNADRASLHLTSVVSDPRLTACAEWKALNLAANLYLDHADHAPPLDRGPADRFADYYPTSAAWGENIAYAFLDASSVMHAFLSDEGHKQNVENESWAGVGLAVAQASNGLLFWVQDYGSDQVGPTPPPVPSGTVLTQWMSGVLPLIEATSQYQKWVGATTRVGMQDAAAWRAYLANPHAPAPAMKTPYGKALVAELHLAASQ